MNWYTVICQALWATQLTRSGKWQKAQRLMNNTQHGEKNESIRNQSSTISNEQGLPRQAV